MINGPGNYQVEIRVRKQADGKGLRAWLKTFTIKDERFFYRKQAISASIHPAGAAGLMQMVLQAGKELGTELCREGGVIMDPCCGSGTLLMERAMLPRKKPAAMLGVDISEIALKAAETNIQAGKDVLKGMKVKLVKGDLKELRLQGQISEVYANLPFGNRVGSHKENRVLYRSLFDQLPIWLREEGIAVLYSMEGKLLTEEAKRCKDTLQLLHVHRVEAGGLEPTVIILKKK